MGFISKVRSMFGAGEAQSASTGQEGGGTRPSLTLQVRVPKAENAIWESFTSFDLRLAELTLETTAGRTVDLAVAGAADYRDEAYLEGKDAVYQLSPDPATYEAGTVSMEVMDYELRAGAPDWPFHGFDGAPLDFGGETFEPTGGAESTITLVVSVRADDEADAYVLDPALEW